jgi:flagellar hook-associated protein FlgK
MEQMNRLMDALRDVIVDPSASNPNSTAITKPTQEIGRAMKSLQETLKKLKEELDESGGGIGCDIRFVGRG